jgi:hypothetical protein
VLARGACLGEPSLVVAGAWVTLNLIAVPVAGAVILRKRGLGSRGLDPEEEKR